MKAQPLPDSLRLDVSGPMPAAFLKNAQERLESLQGENVGRTDDVFAYFYKTANQLTDFLHGGKVLYNDRVSRYLAQVMDSLLVAEPEIRNTLQVYAVRDLSPNAAVTPDGLVLVNLGLLAQVESEAELAFVISHEISHYVRQHAFRRLSESAATMLNGSNLARDLYNQAQEREADQAGFTRILRTRYTPAAALRVFSRLSSGEVYPTLPLDLAWLAPRGLPLPTCGNARAESPELSRLGSHPLPQSRLQALSIIAAQADTARTRYYLVGENAFRRCQLIARYQVARIALQERRYEEALTMAYSLWRQAPENIFARRVAARALYGLSAYADEGNLYEVHLPAQHQTRARLSCLVETLSPRELNALALHYNWQLWSQGDSSALPWVENLLFRLARYHMATREVMAPPGSRAESWLQPVFRSERLEGIINTQLQKGWMRKENLSPPALDSLPEKVVVISPAYRRLDNRKGKYPDLPENDSARIWFKSLISELLHQQGFEVRFLEDDDPEEFLHLSHLYAWENERRLHGEAPILASQQEWQASLSEYYGTSLFMWAGVVSETDYKRRKVLRLLAGLPILPYTLVRTFSPRRTTYMYTLVYNFGSGAPLLRKTRSIPRKDRKGVVTSALYDMLIEIPARKR